VAESVTSVNGQPECYADDHGVDVDKRSQIAFEKHLTEDLKQPGVALAGIGIGSVNVP